MKYDWKKRLAVLGLSVLVAVTSINWPMSVAAADDKTWSDDFNTDASIDNWDLFADFYDKNGNQLTKNVSVIDSTDYLDIDGGKTSYGGSLPKGTVLKVDTNVPKNDNYGKWVNPTDNKLNDNQQRNAQTLIGFVRPAVWNEVQTLKTAEFDLYMGLTAGSAQKPTIMYSYTPATENEGPSWDLFQLQTNSNNSNINYTFLRVTTDKATGQRTYTALKSGSYWTTFKDVWPDNTNRKNWLHVKIGYTENNYLQVELTAKSDRGKGDYTQTFTLDTKNLNANVTADPMVNPENRFIAFASPRYVSVNGSSYTYGDADGVIIDNFTMTYAPKEDTQVKVFTNDADLDLGTAEWGRDYEVVDSGDEADVIVYKPTADEDYRSKVEEYQNADKQVILINDVDDEAFSVQTGEWSDDFNTDASIDNWDLFADFYDKNGNQLTKNVSVIDSTDYLDIDGGKTSYGGSLPKGTVLKVDTNVPKNDNYGKWVNPTDNKLNDNQQRNAQTLIGFVRPAVWNEVQTLKTAEFDLYMGLTAGSAQKPTIMYSYTPATENEGPSWDLFQLQTNSNNSNINYTFLRVTTDKATGQRTYTALKSGSYWTTFKDVWPDNTNRKNWLHVKIGYTENNYLQVELTAKSDRGKGDYTQTFTLDTKNLNANVTADPMVNPENRFIAFASPRYVSVNGSSYTYGDADGVIIDNFAMTYNSSIEENVYAASILKYAKDNDIPYIDTKACESDNNYAVADVIAKAVQSTVTVDENGIIDYNFDESIMNDFLTPELHSATIRMSADAEKQNLGFRTNAPLKQRTGGTVKSQGTIFAFYPKTGSVEDVLNSMTLENAKDEAYAGKVIYTEAGVDDKTYIAGVSKTDTINIAYKYIARSYVEYTDGTVYYSVNTRTDKDNSYADSIGVLNGYAVRSVLSVAKEMVKDLYAQSQDDGADETFKTATGNVVTGVENGTISWATDGQSSVTSTPNVIFNYIVSYAAKLVN